MTGLVDETAARPGSRTMRLLGKGTGKRRKGKAKKPRRTYIRQVETPEGVALNIELASWGTRALALIVDLVIMTVTLIVASLIVIFVFGKAAGVLGSITILLLVFFLLRNLYFILFEMLWRGTTPGKRMLGIRVMNARGGALSGSGILARNVMREVELFMPIAVLTSRSGDWSQGLAALWLLMLLLLPFFNRNGQRAGDMIAGTWVVRVPRPVLLSDVARLSETARKNGQQRAEELFTPAELDQYGIYELQTLEKLLQVTGKDAEQTIAAVAEKVCRKLDRPQVDGIQAQRLFLQNYYGALRKHLEAKMLFGVRKEDKFDTS